MCSNTCCMALPSPAVAVCLMPQVSWREKMQCPAWKAFSSEQQGLKGLLWVRAAGWSLSCCRASAAIHHWTGCRMGKGTEGCFVPMVWGFWLINPWCLWPTGTVCRFQGVSVHLHGLCFTQEPQRSSQPFPDWAGLVEQLSPDTRMMRSFACDPRRLWKYRMVAGTSLT